MRRGGWARSRRIPPPLLLLLAAVGLGRGGSPPGEAERAAGALDELSWVLGGAHPALVEALGEGDGLGQLMLRGQVLEAAGGFAAAAAEYERVLLASLALPGWEACFATPSVPGAVLWQHAALCLARALVRGGDTRRAIRAVLVVTRLHVARARIPAGDLPRTPSPLHLPVRILGALAQGWDGGAAPWSSPSAVREHTREQRAWEDKVAQMELQVAEGTYGKDPQQAMTTPLGGAYVAILARSQAALVADAAARMNIAALAPNIGGAPPTTRLRIGFLYTGGSAFHHVFSYMDRALVEVHALLLFQGDDAGGGSNAQLRHVHSPKDAIVDGRVGSPREDAEHVLDLRADARVSSEMDVARRINELGIHVMIDLNGPSSSHLSSLHVAAWRPAPVQMLYAHHCMQSGAEYVDHYIADHVTAPPDLAPYFVERLAYMPGSFDTTIDFRRRKPRPQSRAMSPEHGLPPGYPLLYAPHRFWKIDPPWLLAVVYLLSKVQRATLVLTQYKNWESAETSYRAFAARFGIAERRIRFVPLVDQLEYMRRETAFDLMLDAHMFNAHSTAIATLWAGVPVLTLPGDSIARRVCSGYLRALRLDVTVARSREDYEDVALRLIARGGRMLAKVRARFEGCCREEGVAIFDAEAFAGRLVRMQRMAWDGFESRGGGGRVGAHLVVAR